MDFQRKRLLWQKLEQGQIKHEIEYEYALYLMIDKINLAMFASPSSIKGSLALADILYLADVHRRDCNRHQCACEKLQLVQYLLNKGHIYSDHNLILNDDEITLLNSACQDGFVQSDKRVTTSRALTILQNYNFYQVSRMVDYRENNAISFSNKQSPKKKIKFGKFEENTQEAKKKEDEYQVQINIAKLKLTFLNQFSEIFFEDARKKFPRSKRIFFQYTYFTLQFCKNKFMAENLLRNFESTCLRESRSALDLSGGSNDFGGSSKNGWIEHVSVLINEVQTLIEVEKIDEYQVGNRDNDLNLNFDGSNWGIQYLKNGGPVADMSTPVGSAFQPLLYFDPEYFIQMNALSCRFQEQIELMAYQVQSFWRQVQTENFDVENALKQSENLACSIVKVYETYQDIETASENRGTTNSGSSNHSSGPSGSRNFDFRITYSFAQLQRLLFNDKNQYELMFQKISAQRDILKLIHNNKLQSLRGPGDTGFFIVRGDDRNFGKIILGNQFLRKNLGYTSKDLRHKGIKDLMPDLIQQWHNRFVADFSKTGGAHNGILGKTTCVFLKKKNGYVTPAMINVRFHYSKDYDFTFICFTSFLKEIQIQRGAGANKTPLDHVLFFLVNDIDGRVIDFSESCESQIQLSLQSINNGELDTKYQGFSVEDLVPSLTHERIQELGIRGEMQQNRNPSLIRDLSVNSEEIIDIDINRVQNLKQIGGLNSNYGNSYLNKPKLQKALCQVFRETYGQDKDKVMNIVAIVLVDQIASKEYYQNLKKEKNEKKKTRILKTQREEKKIELYDQANSIGQDSIQAIQFGLFLGKRKEHNDSNSNQNNSSLSQNIILEAQGLKQLYHSTDKQTSSSLKLVTQLMFMVFVLLLTVSAINLVLSMKQNTSLQGEIETVKLSYDRQARHVQIRALLRGMLNMANGYEPTEKQLDADRFGMYMKAFNSQILSLKETHDLVEKDNFQYSDSFRKMLDDKNINLDYLDPFNKPTIEYQSYSYALNLFIQRASTVTNWGIDQFRGNIRQLKIMMPLNNYRPTDDERSLFFLIKACQNTLRSQGHIISSQFRSETNEHALSVAQKTEITIIVSIASIILVTLIISPIICRIQERKYIGIKFFLQIDIVHLQSLDDQVYEFLQLAFADPSIHTAATHQEAMVLDEKTREYLNELGVFPNEYLDPLKNLYEAEDQIAEVSEPAESEVFFVCRAIEDEFMTNSLDSHHQEEIKPKIPEILIKRLGINETSNNFDNNADGNIKPKVIQIDISAEDRKKDEEEEKDQKLQEQITKAENQAAKIAKIYQTVNRQKAKTVLMVIVLALCFCSYFAAGYFFSVNSFAKTPSILDDLDTTYSQDINIDSLITFVREDYLYNQSISSTDSNNQSGSAYFLEKNQERAQNFIRIRKELPAVFQDVQDYFNQIETEQLCQISFVNRPQEKDRCLTIYNGLLKKGLTYSINVVLSHFRNLNLQFTTNRNRSTQFILDALKDQDTLELIEMQEFIMSEIYLVLKDKVTDSTTKYYNRLIQQYKGLFSAFIALMTILFGGFLVFGYGKIKDSMWRTNLSLKIMPLELLPKGSLNELKSFHRY